MLQNWMDASYVENVQRILIPATRDTLHMVGMSALYSLVLGLALGTIIYLGAPDGLLERFVIKSRWAFVVNRAINVVLGSLVNVFRSLPFVVLVFAFFPLARFIVGSSIGTAAAIVPLTVAATPFIARLTQATFNELSKGVVEAAICSGASLPQTFVRVILKESAPGLILNTTIAIINLVGLSAMAGLIGGGGLGDAARRYGFDRFQTNILIYCIIILVVLVQLVQFAGDYSARKLDKR